MDDATFTGRLRCDCPVCGRINTFSAFKDRGKIVYRCFSASCKTRGIIPAKRSLGTIRIELSKEVRPERAFESPEHFVKGLGVPESIKWLTKNNCLDAYRKGRFNVEYDPKQNRLVFLIRDKGIVVGANGRSLAGAKPKWYIYPNSKKGVPFIVEGLTVAGRANNLIIVEDCASACAVARLDGYTGMALLGTNFYSEYADYIKGYNSILIALDNDAKRKAVKELVSRLEYIAAKKVSIVFLTKDIKDLSLQELENVV